LSETHLPKAEPHDPSPGTDFAAQVEQHWSAVCRYLHTLTGNAHDTEDLAQETFLKAWRSSAAFQAGTNCRAWLLRIAGNTFFDLWRRRKRAAAETLGDDVYAASAHPAEPLIVAEQAELLRGAMNELPPVTRAVFHLRAAEELSFREIAEAVGVSEVAARWHMGQARKKLLARLEKPTERTR
jgi:RNA polymerase sigma-70 factor (ECF subfamily)